MRFYLLLFCFCCWTVFSTYGQSFQEETCGTIDVPDPNFNLQEFREFQQAKALKSGKKEVTYLPLAIRIVRRSDGTGGFPTDRLEEIIDSVNVRFQGSNLQFFQCSEPNFVDVNAFYDFDYDLYADSLITYNIPKVINVYLISKIINGASFLCGYASFPWTNQEYVVVKNSCALNGSTFAHEIGHYLGLWHTHTTNNGTEYADGSNCVFAGDELCGTPADPTLGSYNVNVDCEYTGNTRDANGDPFEPDPTNIMSYSRKACRTYFSQDQFDRMEFYYDRFRKDLACQTATNIQDELVLTDLKLFPNPAKERIHLSFELTEPKDLHMEILDMCGAQLYEVRVSSGASSAHHEFSLAQLTAGIYLMRISDGEKQVLRKFVHQ